MTCTADLIWSHLVCLPNPCDATEVANSDYSDTGSITGTTGASVTVTCASGYSGGGDAVCATDGTFNSLSCSVNSCTATEVANSDYSDTGSITGTTGDIVSIECDTGYLGSGDVECLSNGEFSEITCSEDDTSSTNTGLSTLLLFSRSAHLTANLFLYCLASLLILFLY